MAHGKHKAYYNRQQCKHGSGHYPVPYGVFGHKERLEAQGVKSFTPKQALNLLGRFIQEEPSHVGVMSIDWRRWGEAATC